MAAMKPPPSPEASGNPDSHRAAREDIPRVDSEALLGPGGRVVIEHRGQFYELRETRFGKLILTK